MNSEEVIKVIDALCDKLEIAVNSAKDFVPALAKYQIVSNIFDSVMSGLIIAISIVAIKKAYESAVREFEKEKEARMNWEKHDSPMDFWRVAIALPVGVIAIIIFVCLFVVSVRDVLIWTISPETSAIDYVLNALRNM